MALALDLKLVKLIRNQIILQGPVNININSPSGICTEKASKRERIISCLNRQEERHRLQHNTYVGTDPKINLKVGKVDFIFVSMFYDKFSLSYPN